MRLVNKKQPNHSLGKPNKTIYNDSEKECMVRVLDILIEQIFTDKTQYFYRRQ